jgi:uncharacterized YigZ family protein
MIHEKKIVPAGRAEIELFDRNSRFIASAAPVFSVEAARAFIEEINSKYPDASHHVPVYIIGHGSSTIAHCSDDGEPSGTAGRPALSVLTGSGIGDIAIVITRYFGGTKLGTGGLVRAYGDSVRSVLKALPLARKVSTTSVMFVIPYALFERTEKIIRDLHGLETDRDFAADVTLTVRLPDGQVDLFEKQMIALTQGQVEFIQVDHQENTILPL